MCVRATRALCLGAFWWPIEQFGSWYIYACNETFQYVHMYSAQEEEICSGLYIPQT